MTKRMCLSVLLIAAAVALVLIARAGFAIAQLDPLDAKQQVAAAAAGAPANDAKKDPDAPKRPFSAKELRRVLAEPTDKLKTGIDKGTPLKDALDFICRIHLVRPNETIRYRIDHQAFADAGEPNIEEKQVELPPMPMVPLAVILNELLGRMEPECRGTFRIVNGYLEITTLARLNSGYYFDQPIDIEFDKLPLAEALQEVMDKNGVTTVLDGSVGEKAKTPVTTIFHQVPLETVVRLLADMADLRVVPMQNMLYVTSKEKADALRKEKERWQQEKQERELNMRGGSGV